MGAMVSVSAEGPWPIARSTMRTSLRMSYWTDQVRQLAVFGLDNMVDILHLAMHCLLTTFAFGLQDCNRYAAGGRFVRLDDLRLLPGRVAHSAPCPESVLRL
jgi:hypothetical protein